MKSIYLAATAIAMLALAPANAATFNVGHGVGTTACNSSSSTGPFATGEVLTYASGGCQGGYSVFLDTTAKTIIFTTAIAPFADYRFSEFSVTGISEVTITSLQVLQLAPLFNTTSRPAPSPQLSFTGSSINILFGDKTGSGPVFDLSTNGGQAIFAYNASGAVPEPASWTMLIAGFGLVGAAMRRRVAAAA
jgi:hypothetical protein